MKVRLVKRTTVVLFAEAHANGKVLFNKWMDVIEAADWEKPIHIKASYKADLIGHNKVVFDVGGGGPNAFRIICHFHFGRKNVHLYINWIGTHEQYNALTPWDKLMISRY